MKLNKSGKKKIRQALLKKGLKLESYWKQEVPVFTGQYKASITTEVVDWNHVVVGTNVPQAVTLEFNVEQDFPPVDELKKWVERKISPDPDEVDSVTYLIGRKIDEEGVETQQPLQKAIRKFKTKE
ncbi:MAG: hypothetical protein ACNS64_01220 [Candidatus Halalkalibacterium sp. M3_1C_030]